MRNPSNESDIQEALTAVTSSVTFSRAPRLRDLLRYLIEDHLVSTDQSMRGTEIALAVFHLDENTYDPAFDSIVRVSINRLREILARYYAKEGANQPLRFEIPRGSYTPIIRRRTPAGLSTSVRIAVLPLEDHTKEADGYWLCEGLTGDLINALARVSQLQVFAHTSTVRYGNANKDVRDVAKELDANLLVKGRVQKVEDRLSLCLDLVLGSDGSHLWNQAFETTIDDRAALQGAFLDLVGRSVEIHSSRTAPVIDALERNRIPALAHALLDQARAAVTLSTTDAVKRAESLCLEAINLAPEYAAAWAELGVIRFRSRALIFSNDSVSLDTIEDALARALALDPDEPTALSIRGTHRSVNLFDWVGGIADARRAAELTPNSAANCSRYGALCLWAGLTGPAREMLPHALRLDPHSPLANYYRVALAHFDESSASVMELLSIARKRAGDLLVFDELEIGFLVNLGDFEAAHTLARIYRRKHKGAFAIEYRRAQAMAGLGDLAGARTLYSKLSRNINPVSLDYYATGIEVCANDEDAIYHHAHKAIDARAPHTCWFGLRFFSPKFVGPRGAEIFARLRRSPEPPHLPIDFIGRS
jgi:TolB-like protein